MRLCDPSTAPSRVQIIMRIPKRIETFQFRRKAGGRLRAWVYCSRCDLPRIEGLPNASSVRLVVMLGLAMCAVATSAYAQSPITCLRPWAIPDKWIDRHDDPNDGVWTADDTFETVDAHGNPLSDPDVYADIYTNPAGGTGFKLPDDVGLLLTLKIADAQDGMKSGFFYAVNIGTAGEGANGYRSEALLRPGLDVTV